MVYTKNTFFVITNSPKIERTNHKVLSLNSSPPMMPVTVPLRANGTALVVDTLITLSNSMNSASGSGIRLP